MTDTGTGASTEAGGGSPGASAPQRGPDATRRRELTALRERLTTLQGRLAAVREGTRALAGVELERRLTAEETRRARALRWEGECLRHELALLRERFERVLLESPGAPRPDRC